MNFTLEFIYFVYLSCLCLSVFYGLLKFWFFFCTQLLSLISICVVLWYLNIMSTKKVRKGICSIVCTWFWKNLFGILVVLLLCYPCVLVVLFGIITTFICMSVFGLMNIWFFAYASLLSSVMLFIEFGSVWSFVFEYHVNEVHKHICPFLARDSGCFSLVFGCS